METLSSASVVVIALSPSCSFSIKERRFPRNLSRFISCENNLRLDCLQFWNYNYLGISYIAFIYKVQWDKKHTKVFGHALSLSLLSKSKSLFELIACRLVECKPCRTIEVDLHVKLLALNLPLVFDVLCFSFCHATMLRVQGFCTRISDSLELNVGWVRSVNQMVCLKNNFS